jgi:lysosomal Pro-X carboxypeptidase
MWERAPTFKAMVVFVEHRYYGESQPYGNKSYESLTQLGYLSSEQALADYASYIQNLKATVPGAANSPVIAFGGSYGGMLASWFRMKYPHIVEGALAASAPILQFTGIYDCNGYFDIITKDFTQYSPDCSASIKNSWSAVRRVASEDGGSSWLQSTFNVCEDLNQEGNLEKFIVWLSGAYESLGMTDYPNAATFLQPLPAYPMKETCKLLTNPNQDDKALLLDVFNAVSIFYNYTGWNSDCNTIEADAMSTGWDFQFCTEMVLPVCSNGVTDMFEDNPWNVSALTETCLKNWKVSPELYKAEYMYGGKNISTASNIIFSNGDRDPWSAGGVLEQLGPNIDIINVPHACHHEDLRPTGENDPPSLRAVREQEVEIIKKWLDKYYDRIGHKHPNWLNSV